MRLFEIITTAQDMEDRPELALYRPHDKDTFSFNKDHPAIYKRQDNDRGGVYYSVDDDPNDPHLISKFSHSPVVNDTTTEGFTGYIKALLHFNMIDTNPFAPRIYNINQYRHPTAGFSHFNFQMEKLIHIKAAPPLSVIPLYDLFEPNAPTEIDRARYELIPTDSRYYEKNDPYTATFIRTGDMPFKKLKNEMLKRAQNPKELPDRLANEIAHDITFVLSYAAEHGDYSKIANKKLKDIIQLLHRLVYEGIDMDNDYVQVGSLDLHQNNVMLRPTPDV